jgi:hypothetical protein
MSYRYHNRNRRRPTGAGSRWMPLRYAGTCRVCAEAIPAGATAYWDAAARAVTCSAIECAKADGLTRSEWVGSPVSGGYVDVLAESRIGAGVGADTEADAFRYTRSRGYFGPNVRRCEDAPCCGCCS